MPSVSWGSRCTFIQTHLGSICHLYTVASGGHVTQTKGVQKKALFPIYMQAVKQSFSENLEEVFREPWLK